jgi:hypothetical protein
VKFVEGNREAFAWFFVDGMQKPCSKALGHAAFASGWNATHALVQWTSPGAGSGRHPSAAQQEADDD